MGKENRTPKSLEPEIRKCIEGILPPLSSNYHTRHKRLQLITLILSLVPLLTYILT